MPFRSWVFIEIRPRSKMVVRSIVESYFIDPITYLIEDDIDKVFELLEVREAREGWAAYTASKRVTEEDIRKLQEIIEKDQENLRKGFDDAKGMLIFMWPSPWQPTIPFNPILWPHRITCFGRPRGFQGKSYSKKRKTGN